ncbi:hypothetical protein M2165_004226 [Variovorax sp. TBS-050B]|uniref:hypothetical protein n=1 Tax=Variovorax sp. TBS-050B TaxID=2940551 RepID=UPI00247553C1|nr:hypothetical protein [Variovorax sp. TBS-050B]MDH6594337.1 hypothetical protein [Variovorax sp. TBS-050B]
MGIQDRDWYREEVKRKAREEANANTSRKQRRAAGEGGPPKLIGADWHWSLQLLVWLAIAVLAIMLIRLLGL